MNLFLFVYFLVIFPKLLWDRVYKKKKHPSLLQRLAFKMPPFTSAPLIWIHAVSVGEIKASEPFLKGLKDQFPNHQFLITTTTATGQKEAKRILPADLFAYLPLDFSWTVRKWVKKFNPQMVFFVESDFWPNLLKELRRNQTKIYLVSAKLSKRSARRFMMFQRFAKKLFGYFDQICVQSEEHYQRFLPFVADPQRLHISGNFKLDVEPQGIDHTSFFPQPAITISCTHAPEEEAILDALQDSPYFLILAPRHPERFAEVAKLLKRRNIAFTRLSEHLPYKKVLLIDEMGKLSFCYANSRLAIVGGSFVSHIGGHNVLEPCLYGTPVLFGPHMFGQKELAKLAIQSKAGRVVLLEDLSSVIDSILSNHVVEQSMREGAKAVFARNRGAVNRAMDCIFKVTQ